MNRGEVWFVKFPLEENPNRFLRRPVIVLSENLFMILSVKVTSHGVRYYDPYDIEIINWQEAGLDRPSTARISKTVILPRNKFLFKIGELTDYDLNRVLTIFNQFLDDNPVFKEELNNLNLF